MRSLLEKVLSNNGYNTITVSYVFRPLLMNYIRNR